MGQLATAVGDPQPARARLAARRRREDFVRSCCAENETAYGQSFRGIRGKGEFMWVWVSASIFAVLFLAFAWKTK